MRTVILMTGALALTACAQYEPITDDSVYIQGKGDPVTRVAQATPVSRNDCHYNTVWWFQSCTDDPHDPMMPPTKEPPTKEPKPPAERVKGNNGLGNGDQPAPGKSLDRNKAENQRGNPGHASGKPQRSN